MKRYSDLEYLRLSKLQKFLYRLKSFFCSIPVAVWHGIKKLGLAIWGFIKGIGLSVAEVVTTFKKVFPYILIGVGIGSIIHNWIPEAWVEAVLGSRNPLGVVLATLVGVPMYADIFGAIPVAEALLGKGALLGTILSFMMAVTTLSLPSLIMLRKAVKPRLLATFIAICIIGIIMVGYGFNAFQYILL